MPEEVTIPVADLLLDPKNARLKEEQKNQQDTMIKLAEKEGDKLIELAKDIVDRGLNPLTFPAVAPSPNEKKRYIVYEGNRRVLALKALETPSLINQALSNSKQKQLRKLSKEYAKDPFSEIRCILFESEEEIEHWIWIRHTGQNNGKGLVEWGADEQDRYAARRGERSAARQILDFVERRGWLSDEATKSDKGIITSIRRLVSNPYFRDRIGIDKTKGEIYALYPANEIGKSLTHVVEDLKLERVQVGDIYTAEDREEYADALPESRLPEESKKLDEPIHIDKLLRDDNAGSEESEGSQNGGEKDGSDNSDNNQESSRENPLPRTHLIPRDCSLNINQPRINKIYQELKSLRIENYPNSASVMLRVFVELSIDQWIESRSLLTENDLRNQPLAKRIKVVASDLHSKSMISKRLKDAMEEVSDRQGALAASTPTFNLYVHNQYVYPTPSELRTAWDELQPFIKTIWS